VILNALTEIGFERLVDKKKAFINLTRHFFTDLPPIPFKHSRVVLEILEDIEVDNRLVKNIKALYEDGYSLALDDFNFEERWTPLIPYVDIIKVEIPAVDWANLPNKILKLRQKNIKVLAEKVETEEEFKRLHDMGFDYFQGYFFSRPNVVSAKRLSESQIVVMQLLAKLSQPDVEVDELEQLISLDPGLSLKILRYLNSAAVGLPRKIESIRQAVIYLGLQRIKAWSMLVSMAGLEGKPHEVFNSALVRAHMCAHILEQSGQASPDTGFTAGLLSILDVLMDQELSSLLAELPLSEEIRNGLINRKGPIGQAIVCTLAYEKHQWKSTSFPGLSRDDLLKIYLTSSQLAFSELAGLTEQS
ncbi:MAG: HDOD domain-containing protein, partial [Chromatiales bacterium]|nr:HDOD domain-containing protein [Chromatiales bacterium]